MGGASLRPSLAVYGCLLGQRHSWARRAVVVVLHTYCRNTSITISVRSRAQHLDQDFKSEHHATFKHQPLHLQHEQQIFVRQRQGWGSSGSDSFMEGLSTL